jgi:2-methylisocitrate lyase-like PEP mutase family enzyme
MPTLEAKVRTFRDLHRPGDPFIIPNPWDVGSARVLAGLGFEALATTSSGFAFTRGRRDYGVGRDEALAHAHAIAEATDVPVSADLENGFGVAPEAVAETFSQACAVGVAGASIEDSTGDASRPVFDIGLAVERVTAAVEAVRGAPTPIVLTARAEALLYGETDLDAVIGRLQAFEAAGADVLYAPGLSTLEAVRTVCAAVRRPVNVLLLPSLAGAALDDIAEAGAARVSLGGTLAWSVLSGLLHASGEMLSEGRFTFAGRAAEAAPTLKGFLR